MHTVIDLRGSFPVFIHITDGRWHDSNALKLLEVVFNAIYMMDKAYINFEALFRIDAEGAFFVTRAKDNMKYEIISSNFNCDPMCGVTGDHLIKLTGYKSSKLYPKELWLVEFCDIESGEQLQFITNVTDTLEFSGLEIANLYRHRWGVESFSKLIKQNPTVRKAWPQHVLEWFQPQQKGSRSKVA